MGHILNFLNKKITTKLISAFLAIMLWFIVLNINDPYGERKIYVELDVRNENILQEKNLFLSNKNYRRTVEVSVKGREKTLNGLSSADFDAILDFSKIQSVNDKSIPIDGPYYTKNDNQISIAGMSPKEIPIELENMIKKELPVKAELKGIPKQSYKIIKTIIEPEYISITDRESLINSISHITAFVDITNIDRDKKIIKQPYIVYNKNNEEIASLSNKNTVDIVLDVGKEVTIEPTIVGEPAADHILTGWKIDVPTAIVTGSYDIVSILNTINTAQINIDGITSTRDYKAKLKIPEGVNLYGSEDEVTITAEIEKLIEKEILIDRRFISIENTEPYVGNPENKETGHLQYEILTESSKVLLKGRKVNLDVVNPSVLTPHIDVSGLNEGTHKVQLKIYTDPNIQVIKIPSVEIKITKIKNEDPKTNVEDDNNPNNNQQPDTKKDKPKEEDILNESESESDKNKGN